MKMKRAPFSVKTPVDNVPFTAKLNSVARGCVWGVLYPQGPKNPIVIAIPVPIRAGNVPELAVTECPPAPVVTPPDGCKKSKTN